MLCQNCGKNEANIRYTQIINGVKKEINLCTECAKSLGMENLEMPINFNSFLGDFFNDYAETGLLPTFHTNELKCKKCGMTYSGFIDSGVFGCSECYNVFSNPIESLLKNLHGTANHVGRVPKGKVSNMENHKGGTSDNIENEKNSKTDKSKLEQDNKTRELERKLELAIKEERYEDAAKIRDELKEMGK